MAECVDSINHCSPEQVKIPYDFYNDYISNKNFLEIFNKRKQYIRNKTTIKNMEFLSLNILLTPSLNKL